MSKSPYETSTPVRSTLEHPDRAPLISTSRSQSPSRRSVSPDRYRPRSSSQRDYHSYEDPRDSMRRYLPAKEKRGRSGTNLIPVVPRDAWPLEALSLRDKALDEPAVASDAPPVISPQVVEKKKHRLYEYLNGPPDPPADVIAWTGVSARNQKLENGSSFYTGAYAIVWEKGGYENQVKSFVGPGKSNVYAEFQAVAHIVGMCKSNERLLVKTTSSEVINALQIGMNTEFWKEVSTVRSKARRLVNSRSGRTIFKKVPSRVGLPQNDQACAMADQARKKIEGPITTLPPPPPTVLAKPSPQEVRREVSSRREPPSRRESSSRREPPPRREASSRRETSSRRESLRQKPEPSNAKLSEEKAQEFLEDFSAFLRDKALASRPGSSTNVVDDDGHRLKARKLSHPSQRDPRIHPRQVAVVQNIIRPNHSSSAKGSQDGKERSNDTAQESDNDEYYDAIDYWVDPEVTRAMDKDKPATENPSTLSWISNLFEE